MAPSQTRWLIVALGAIAGVTASMQAGKAPPALGLLRAEFDLSLIEAGWVVSILAATSATIGVLTGGISDRIGNRRTITICTGLVVLGNLIGAFSTSADMLLASRFVEGIGFVGIVVSVPSILIRVTTASDQRFAFGIWGSYMPMGMALMMASAPFVLTPFGWRGLWIANAVVIALFGVVFHFLTRDLEPKGKVTDRPPVGAAIVAVLRRPGPWLLGLCFMTYAGQWVGLMAWLPTFLTETLGYSVRAAALWSAAVVAMNIPGNWFGGWLLHRGVTRWYMPAIACALMGLSGLAIFSPLTPDLGRIGLALFFSFIAGLLPPTLLSGAPLHAPAPNLVATANGVIVNGANIGSLLGPPAFGALIAAMGSWQASGVMMALAGLAGLIFAILLGVVERRLTVAA